MQSMFFYMFCNKYQNVFDEMTGMSNNNFVSMDFSIQGQKIIKIPEEELKMKNLMKKIFAPLAVLALAVGVGINLNLETDFINAQAINYAAEADFTLKSAKSSAYNSDWTYGSWELYGAANNNGGWAFMKFGGKNTTLATANPVYLRGQVPSKSVSQIDVVFNVGNLTVGSVNSWGVDVYSDSGYTNLVDSVLGGTMSTKTAQTLSLVPTSSWAAGLYYKVYFDLANTTGTNGIVWVDKIQFVENADVSKTLTNLSFTGTPTKTTYIEGDVFDPTGLIVTATYSDSSSSDVTLQTSWQNLIVGMTSIEGTYTYLSISLNINVGGLIVNEAPAIGGIIDGHAYLVTAFNSTTADTQYILRGGNTFASGFSASNTEEFTSPANYSLNDAFVFTRVAINEYQITSGLNYLGSTNTNNGLILGETEGSWTVSLSSGTTSGGISYDGIFLQDTTYDRYLTAYASTPNFRTYTSTTSQPLPAACIVLYDMTVLEGFDEDYTAARDFADDVVNGEGLNAQDNCEAVHASLMTKYNALSEGAKEVFEENAEAIFVSARARLAYLDSWVAAQPGSNPTRQSTSDQSRNNLVAVISIGAIGLTSILGYYFVSKKKKLS